MKDGPLCSTQPVNLRHLSLGLHRGHKWKTRHARCPPSLWRGGRLQEGAASAAQTEMNTD